jgi:hypothetical protein
LLCCVKKFFFTKFRGFEPVNPPLNTALARCRGPSYASYMASNEFFRINCICILKLRLHWQHVASSMLDETNNMLLSTCCRLAFTLAICCLGRATFVQHVETVETCCILWQQASSKSNSTCCQRQRGVTRGYTRAHTHRLHSINLLVTKDPKPTMLFAVRKL